MRVWRPEISLCNLQSRSTEMSTRLAMVVCLLLVAPTVHAQTTIDVTKITCKQFVLLKVADPDKLALWLSGYFHAKRGSTTVDVQLLKEQPEESQEILPVQRQGGDFDASGGKIALPIRLGQFSYDWEGRCRSTLATW